LNSGTIPKIPSTTGFKQGDIIRVPFPFTDFSKGGRRAMLESEGFVGWEGGGLRK
jgi:hypothetical protein